MTFDKEQVLSILRQSSDDGIKVGALLDELGISRGHQRSMRRFLDRLIQDNFAEKVARGTYALADAVKDSVTRSKNTVDEKQNKTRRKKGNGDRSMASVRAHMPDAASPQCEGRIRVHPAGYGFVVRDDGLADVFIPAKYRGAALDGDQVLIYTWEGFKGTEGRVEEVLARGRAKITGLLEKSGSSFYVVPDDPRIATDFGRVGVEDGPGGARLGECVVVSITRYPSEIDNRMLGRITKVLGPPDSPRTEIQKIIVCADLPYEMPEEATTQAGRIRQELGPEDFADRIDLRDRDFLTIDPETARDFDDAICIEEGPRGGPRIWVAVADVSHYVHPGDALDREAQIRGVSVYLPDQVIPMLPMAISAGICSLNPHVDRCAMVVRMDFDSSCHLRDTGFAAAVIQSSDRLDYPGVASALSGDFRGRRESYRKWAPDLHRLHDMAQRLRERRRGRGTLELDIPEAKVVLDADDPLMVRDVVRSKGSDDVKEAYQLVEEFMIAANEAVGAFFKSRDLNTLWRIHAPPKESRVEELAELLGAFGIHVDVEESMTPLGMRRVLDQIEELPSGTALSFLVLRSLTQAIYSTENVGHFGLASEDYLHFTSPIRRYPDLLVHRLLKAQLHKEGQASAGGGRFQRPGQTVLQELAAMCSSHERRAVEAEREAVAMYRAYLMRQHVGEEFKGRISGVTHFGAFVEISEPFVEGLIKVDALGDDLFDFDPVVMQLSGRRTGLTLSLGDDIDVEVLNVSVAMRRVELGLVGGGDRSRRKQFVKKNTRGRGADTAVRKAKRNPKDGNRRRNAQKKAIDSPGASSKKKSTSGTRGNHRNVKTKGPSSSRRRRKKPGA